MSRWGKNIVVPLDSLCKEKENTNRPPIVRSVGTVGKWGKMGFTSTRTYALAALPSVSPGQSPSSGIDLDMSLSLPDAPKPKKFFKSIANAPPEMFAQFIQQLPRLVPTSPIREQSTQSSSQSVASVPSSPHDSVKVTPAKKKVSERKPKASATIKSSIKSAKVRSNKSSDEQVSDGSEANSASMEAKSTKCKKKKELKPEAPPSRVLGRARKTVNYCEDDDEARNATPIKEIVVAKSRRQSLELSPPSPIAATAMNAPKAPEHRPIVLRISKGTSRLVDTDNDEEQEHSPSPQPADEVNSLNSSNSSALATATTEQVETRLPIVTESASVILQNSSEETPEINYSSVKISPDKPPKERLKLIIKTDVIRNAIAAAAAAAANANTQNNLSTAIITTTITTSTTTATIIQSEIDQQQKERKKSKHKHKSKQQIQENNKLPPPIYDFKAPSPNVANLINANGEALTPARTVFSPAGLSERDFDSQSSVLGSISSKGNSTPLIAHTAGPEESYVVHSRGSSVITSDLETSQHSSLVAPPSDIETRLESMMMDGSETGGASRAATIGADEPLQEDILSVLRGEDDSQPVVPLTNGKLNATKEVVEEEENSNKQTVKRRGRPPKGGKARKLVEEEEEEIIAPSVSNRRRTGRRQEETKSPVRETEEMAARLQEETAALEEESNAIVTRRGRAARTTRNNAHNNNNNNINKIAANLSAKAEAQGSSALEAQQSMTSTTRSYGRKRKNQQVMQVLQPSAEELEQQPHAAKLANTQELLDNKLQEANAVTNHLNNNSPPRQDYKVKDKFKRTIMLDNNQGNCNAVVATPTHNYVGEKESSAAHSGDEQQQRGSVKLVISKKKGSIFKSRTLVPENQVEQKRHLYKHRWNQDQVPNTPNPQATNNEENNTSEFLELFNDFNLPSELETPSNDMEKPAPATNNIFDMDVDDTTNDEPGNSSDKRKGFYTVVRNVKTAHQIQEIGEYQEMNDDVQYILDALQPHNPMSTRVLSALQLASKCMNSAFRMHVRSHDVVTKFFRALSDANHDLSLGLCTSAVMYILSQEGLNMDLDRDSLELMMNLLEAENVVTPAEHATYERNKQKVREMCEEIKAQGKATHLNVDTITVGTLAMETLLSLTSKRAGDWFKEELRELGGLEHIIKTISDCCRPVLKLFQVMPCIIWTGVLMDNMKTVERCMRVLENVTQMNEENQKYILQYENGAMVQTLAILYRLCERELLQQSFKEAEEKELVGGVLRELLMPLMKVFINLTHSFRKDSTLGAEMFGQQQVIFETSFQLVLLTHKYIPERYVFELNILVLLLLINLTMYAQVNRQRVMQLEVCINPAMGSVSAVQALMEYFYKCEELARLVEKNTDAMLDNTDNKEKKKMEEVDETVNNLIQKAGHHMEHTLKGSYAGILIGHLISENEQNEMIVRRYLLGNGFKEIINVLEKYYTFMNLTASSDAFTVAHIKSTKELIDYYKRRDLIYAENTDIPTNLQLQEDDELPTTSTRGGTQRVYKNYSNSQR